MEYIENNPLAHHPGGRDRWAADGEWFLFHIRFDFDRWGSPLNSPARDRADTIAALAEMGRDARKWTGPTGELFVAISR